MELRDELELFEDLLSKKLHPDHLADYPPKADQISAWREAVITEKERIRRCLKKVHYHAAQETLKEQYVQRHQTDLVILIDIAFRYTGAEKEEDLSEHENDSGITKLYKLIYHSLKELLTFIEKHLTRYFNQEESAPLSHQLILKHEFRSRIKRIKRKFAGVSSEKEILQLVITAVNALVKGHARASHRKLIYASTILIELEALDLNHKRQGYFTPLRELMFYMNFNYSLYAHSVINELIMKLNGIKGLQEKLLFLYEYQKELNQLIIKQGVRFRNHLISLKDQVNGWIEEELAYIEKTNVLFSIGPTHTDTPIQDEDKLFFSVPVSVLALLGRSACDAKLILNKNRKRALKTIARLSKTIGSDSPQGHSLLKKSYAAEPSHKEKAIGILHEMIRKIYEY